MEVRKERRGWGIWFSFWIVFYSISHLTLTGMSFVLTPFSASSSSSSFTDDGKTCKRQRRLTRIEWHNLFLYHPTPPPQSFLWSHFFSSLTTIISRSSWLLRQIFLIPFLLLLLFLLFFIPFLQRREQCLILIEPWTKHLIWVKPVVMSVRVTSTDNNKNYSLMEVLAMYVVSSSGYTLYMSHERKSKGAGEVVFFVRRETENRVSCHLSSHFDVGCHFLFSFDRNAYHANNGIMGGNMSLSLLSFLSFCVIDLRPESLCI